MAYRSFDAEDIHRLRRTGAPGHNEGVDRSQAGIIRALELGSTRGPADDTEWKREMGKNRRVNARTASAWDSTSNVVPSGAGGGSLTFATARPRDPFFYWRQNNLPYDVSKEEELVRIRALCRLLYLTHPLISSAIDVMSKFPLAGMELDCKDDDIIEFYETLFFDQLNYKDFLVTVNREYWTVGEAMPLGSFNELLGVWEDDELLNPDDVKVIESPFMREPRFEIRLPRVIREILEKREPEWEYRRLMQSYPTLSRYVNDNMWLPVSNVLLRQLKHQADPYHARGLPILMRGFRTIVQEEMLQAAQDAVASRLYTPLTLFRLGATAAELGTDIPWVPTDDDMSAFEESLDAALAADFRAIIHHFAVDVQNVYGKEMLPDFSSDYDRIDDRHLQIFGLSKSMLTGADAGETYASDALNRDLVTELLTTDQRMLAKFFEARALVVAEAQRHYDYEERNGKRYPILEEVLEIDEETGEEIIVEQPKLLVPELKFKPMNMAQHSTYLQYIESLRGTGVPISMRTRLMTTPIEIDDEIDTDRHEQVDMAIAAGETRKAKYEALRDRGLPIPEDLQDFVAKADEMPTASRGPTSADPSTPLVGPVEDQDALAPPPPPAPGEEEEEQDVASDDAHEEAPPTAASNGNGNVQKLPRNRTRPPESDEQRKAMPKPATRRISRFGAQGWMPDDIEDQGRMTGSDPQGAQDSLSDPQDAQTEDEEKVTDDEVGNGVTGFRTPRSVGSRRYAHLDPDVPLDEQIPRSE